MKRFISVFLSILLIFPVIPLGIVSNVKAATVRVVTVDKTAAANGTTVFNTIQDAINAVPANNTSTTPYEIQIKNGTYIENITLNKSGVTLTGESQDGVILTSALPDLLYINDGGYIKFQRGGTTYNTANEYTPTVLTLKANDCTLQNMTIKLDDYYIDMGPISAVTTDSSAQRNSFKYCTLGGGQDTLYDNGRTYYYKCTISGSVDFMYGGASSVFDSCDIKSIYWERLYNMSEVNGIISYGLSESDRTSRGITADDIALWTSTDPLRSKYPTIVNGPNNRTAASSKPTDFAAPDFTRILTADELNALTDAELSSRQIARDSSNNPNNWKTIAQLTASDSKRIKSVGSGYLTACSTPQTSLGFLYVNCNLIGDSRLNAGSYALGRPWRSYAQTTYVNCKMGPHIAATGWNNWGNTANESTARYEEYGTMNLDGTPYDVSKRYTWAKILNNVEVLSRNPYNYLKGMDGWDPTNQAAYYTELNSIANNLPINSVQYVSSNLGLPTADAASGAAIQWLSSNASLISTTGVVNRPAYNAQNENVTLTAAVTKGGRGVLKDFNLTVLKASDSNSSDPDYIACLDAYSALQTGVIPGLNLSAIKKDLTLPATGINGTTLEWKSFNPGITDTGKVTRPAATASDSTGILQLTIRKNQAAVAYNLDTTVIKYLLPVAGMYTAADFVGAGVGGATGTTSYNYDTNQFSISGTGTGFTKTMVDNDQFYFSGVLMSGDFSISAKITNMTTSTSPTVGLTIRDSLDPLSSHFTQAWQQSNKTRKMFRYGTSSVTGSNSTITLTDTAYIQLSKSGTTITSYVSAQPIPANPPTATTTTGQIIVVNQAANTGIGLDAKGSQKEIYAGLVVNGGASVTFSDVKIVTSAGAVVFDSNAQPPIAPKNVAAASGDKSANITWDAVSNATSYTVKQSTSAQGPFTVTGSVYSTVAGSVYSSVYGSIYGCSISGGRIQAQIGSLVNDQTYYFVVTASNGYGKSSPSEVVSITPATADVTPPVITMTSAAPASQVYGASLPFSGSVDEASTLTIKHNGSFVKLDGNNTSLSLSKNGTFSQTLTLTEGTNNIVISATDARGNKIEKSYTVKYVKLKTSDFVGLDIGSPTAAGSFSFDEDYNVFTVTGAGAGLAKTVAGPDQVYFMAVKMIGDYSISGKLNFKYDPSKHANYTNMGIMIRESSDPACYEYSLQNQYGGKPVIRKAYRYSDGKGGVTAGASNTTVAANEGCYFKMIKTGDDIVVVRSIYPIPDDLSTMVYTITAADGSSVTVSAKITAKALGLGLDGNGNHKELLAGFFVASVNPSNLVTCTFEDIKIVMSDGTVAYDSNEGKPVPPKNVVAKPYSESATITCDAIPAATSYTVYQSESATGQFTPVTVADTVRDSVYNRVTFQVNGLANDKTYYYRVTASNASGESLKSEMVSVTPGAWVLLPPVITMTSAEPDSEVYSAVLPLSGSVNKVGTLTITHNGSLVKLNGGNTSLSLGVNGTFNNTLILRAGVNDIEIKFFDAYGFETKINYTVTYTYKIADISFCNANGNIVTALTAGEDIVVKAEVENYVDSAKDSVLVIGLYNSQNTLVKFIYTAETIFNGESEVFYAKFKLPDDVSGYTVKAFVWDNFVNMHPISDVAVLK